MQEGRSLLTISAGKTGWNSRQLSQGYPESAWTCAASSASLASVPVFGIAKRERPAVRLHSVGPERTAQERLWVAPRPSLIVSANRENAYHNGTLPFSCSHHVNNGQKQDREMELAVGTQQEVGAGGSAGGYQGWQGQ